MCFVEKLFSRKYLRKSDKHFKEIMDKLMLNTQTQPQNSEIFTLESQPIEKIVYGRLYAKNIKLKSFGMKKRRPHCSSSRIHGRMFFKNWSVSKTTWKFS